MRLQSYSLLAFLAVAAPAVSVGAQVLTPYDVFVFNNFAMTSTEVNGTLAVGGSASLTSFGVGRFLTPGFSGNSLVVGGNLTTTAGQIFEGQTIVGGTNSNTLTSFPFAYPPQAGMPIDFLAESMRLTAISNAYAGMTANGTTQLLGGELNFIGTSNYNIFNILISELQAGTAGYEFVTPVGATNIVNVSGTSASSAFNNTAFYFDCTQIRTSSSCVTGTNEATPRAAALTLFNFNQQTDLVIGGPVHGSIFAPNAAVTFGSGDVVGTVIVNSAVSSAEFYSNHDFSGELPSAVTATPEPATFGLFALGLAGLVGVVRRRKA